MANQITDWRDMTETVMQCAHQARDRGYTVFGVQYYSECWAGADGKNTYNKHGTATNCWRGVGTHWSNFVYEINSVSKIKHCALEIQIDSP